jgi:hypothetical protein
MKIVPSMEKIVARVCAPWTKCERLKKAVARFMRSSDEVERRRNALPTSEADLSQSSTPSLAHRRCAARSLEPFVRSGIEFEGLYVKTEKVVRRLGPRNEGMSGVAEPRIKICFD